MARSIKFSTHLDADLEKIYSIFSDRNYWEELMSIYHEYTPVSEVTNFTSDTEKIHLEFKQVILRTDLPPAAQSVIRGDLTVKRVQNYHLESPNLISGDFSGSVAAGPGSLKGVDELYPDERDTNRTVWKRVPTAKVFIPFVNGKLEQIMLVNMIRLFKAEEEFLQNWLKKH